jgi:hypothetical protein
MRIWALITIPKSRRRDLEQKVLEQVILVLLEDPSYGRRTIGVSLIVFNRGYALL